MELKSIFNYRKSIRSFTGEKISEDAMKNILAAANAAPVGMGKYDTLHLTIVSNKELLKKIEVATAKNFNAEGRSFLYNAPELIIISTSEEGNVANSNAAIIAHNMALSAVEENVGACYIWGCMIALSKNPKLIEELEIPKGFRPSCAICLGLSDEKYDKREIRENRISLNRI